MEKYIIKLMFDRKKISSNNSQKLAPISIYISYKGKRYQINTGINIYQYQWRGDRIRAHKQQKELNERLNHLIEIACSYLDNIGITNNNFNIHYLRRILKEGKRIEDISFIDWAIQKVRSKDIKYSTKRRYFSMFNSMKEFGRIKTFEDLTNQTIDAWDKFAHTKCNKPAGVYNYHKILKTLCRDAHYERLIERNPYDGRRLDHGVDDNNRKYLNEKELERLINTKMNTPFLEKVKDLFLFSCYTGMAYADLYNFSIEKCYNTNGRLRYEEKRIKSGVKFCITLLPPAIAILKKYDNRLPTITNAKYNLFLKGVAAVSGINKNLTTHVARHTFATTVALANGVRMEVVAKMLGHKNIQTTQIYAKIMKDEINSEFDRLENLIKE